MLSIFLIAFVLLILSLLLKNMVLEVLDHPLVLILKTHRIVLTEKDAVQRYGYQVSIGNTFVYYIIVARTGKSI